MQESKIIRPEHTILVPYAAGVFGKIRPMILSVKFDVEQFEDSFGLKVVSLTGTEENGNVYDMMFLVEDGNGEGLDLDLMTGIIGNKKYWDETYHWWCEDKPVPEDDEPIVA